MSLGNVSLAIYIAATLILGIILYDDIQHNRISLKCKDFNAYVDDKKYTTYSSKNGECDRYYFILRDSSGNKSEDVRVSSHAYYNFPINKLIKIKLNENTFRPDKVNFLSVLEIFNIFILLIVGVIVGVIRYINKYD